jgi:hypothetical protein
MNRVLKRPMFRMGGSTGTGITSGLDTPRKQYSNGTDPYDRAIKTTDRFDKDISRFVSTQPTFGPGALPGFLTQFGLNLLSQTPTGNIFSTAATAAKEPFQTFQAAQLARNQDKSDLRKDIFTSALASEYDLDAQRIKNQGDGSDDRKTPEVERGIIEAAQNAIFAARDIISDTNSTQDQIKEAQRTIKVNQNVLLKEIGTPPEYAAIIGTPELFDAEMDVIVNRYNAEIQQKRKEFLDKNPDKKPEDAIAEFPTITSNDAKARQLTIEDLRERFFFNKGGRAEFKIGSEPKMMESVAEQKQETGEVQDLSYTELRARLPQEISNDIVMLLANSKQALIDFANIQTTEDISTFNQQYDVNLSLPSGA